MLYILDHFPIKAIRNTTNVDITPDAKGLFLSASERDGIMVIVKDDTLPKVANFLLTGEANPSENTVLNGYNAHSLIISKQDTEVLFGPSDKIFVISEDLQDWLLLTPVTAEKER